MHQRLLQCSRHLGMRGHFGCRENQSSGLFLKTPEARHIRWIRALLRTPYRQRMRFWVRRQGRNGVMLALNRD
jgi:hypothetical protein